jgi:retron-type reverse transcriptase
MSVLQKYFNPDAIKLAYYRVSCWQDRMVKDLLGLRAFGSDLDANCQYLSEKIQAGQYKPQAGLKYYMPKPSKTQRTKTLLMVEDALVYQAIANTIAETAYNKVKEHDNFVFGSVLNPEVAKGTTLLQEEEPVYFFFKFWKNLYQQFKDSIIKAIEVDKVRYKFETDITGFFDSIPHYNLLLLLSQEFNVEDEILDLLEECLNKWSGTKESSTPGVGIPQGPQPSFLLANLLLYSLDTDMVSDGVKYYRYMDDIHIYGYSEEELLDVLVRIDNYTKGHGLSINSKKTSIIEIDPDKEDETVKELKKVRLFSLYDDSDEIEFDLLMDNFDNLAEDYQKPETKGKEDNTKKLKDSLNQMSEQDNVDGFNYFKGRFETIEDEKEIIAFWQKAMIEVENELPELFEEVNDNLRAKKDVTDIDLIRLGVQYSSAIKALQDLNEPVLISEILLKYWVAGLKGFFWRANSYSFTLSLYKNNSFLKNELTDLYLHHFKHYEWVRYQLLVLLSLTQTFTDKELRTCFFKCLKTETSEIVKIALYRLLISNTDDKQFLASVKKELSRERSNYLRWLIIDFIKNQKQYQETDTLTLIESIGI